MRRAFVAVLLLVPTLGGAQARPSPTPSDAAASAKPPTSPTAEASPARASDIPAGAELAELVAPAESVAVRPHRVKLESFRGDTISGVFLVDSDLPSARHVAYGKDRDGFRYVWFSRRNPLRTSLVAIYEVNGASPPDVLYWRQIDRGLKLSRAREFRGPGAGSTLFEYGSGPPCGRPRCPADWRDLPLERIDVPVVFFEPVRRLFHAAAGHGEKHLDRAVDSVARH